MKLSELAKDLKPYIVPWLREASVTVGTGGLSAHALNGSYHTGTLAESQAPWAVTSVAFAAHASNPDAHHAKQHGVVDGAHHTVTGSQWAVVGLSATNTLGILPSSSSPGVTEQLLRAASDGSVNLRAVISSLNGTTGGAIVQGVVEADTNFARAWFGHNAQYDSTSNLWTLDAIGANDAGGFLIPNNSGSVDLIFHPSTGNTTRTMDHATFTGGKKFSFANTGALTGSTSFTTGFTGAGYRLDDGVATTGKTTLELDEMIVRGRMRVYELLIHQIRATNGSVFVSGVGKAKSVSGAGPYTIVTETDHGFAANDLIRAQRFTGSGVYQSNLQVASVASSTQFTATLSSGDAPAAGMEFVRLGNTTDATRQGSIYLTADDTFAPAIDILDGVASFAQWGNASKIKVRLGKLDTTLDANLLPSGYGLYAPNAYLSGDLLTGGGNIRIYNASGINLKEDVWGSWDDKRALQWWPDVANMTGNPSLSIYTGKAVGGLTNNQNFSYIDAKATGGQLAGLSLTAFGQGIGTSATIYLEGGSQALSSLASVTVTASSIDLVGTLLLDGTTSARQINPQSDTGYSLGTALLRWGTLYVNQVVATTISGATMNGQEWEYAGSMIVDANSASNTTVSVVNRGTGLASLNVENNITLGGLVDGVDIALFKSSYDTQVIIYNNHAANVNAHHAQSHVLATTAGLGGDHTVAGLTTGQVLRATSATSAQFMALTSGDITTALGYTPANRAGDAFTGAVTITSNTEGTGSGNQTYQLGVGKSGAGFVQVGTHSGYPALSGQGAGSSFRLLLNPENGGNVGIGTLSPSYTLDVSGTGRIAGALLVQPASNMTSAFEVRDATSIPVFSVDTLNFRAGFGRNDPQAKFHIYTSADEILRLESSSATGSPFVSWYQSGTRRSFVQHNDTGDTLIIASEYGPISFKTDTAGGEVERMQIESGGGVYVASRLGIGISPNASYALDVSGAMRASTSVTSPLFTAASGNVTVSAPATLYLNAATANTVEVQVNGVSQWTASDARLNPRSTIVMDIGDYNRKIRTLHASEMYVETLVAQDVMATLGGRVMVAPTTTLIADLSNSAPSALYTNLIAYWKLDEASGNRSDSKGSNTLTDTNTVTSATGKQSNAAVFTKANSEYLTIADNAALSVGDIDFYMAGWIYPTLDDGTDQYVAAKGGASGNRAWRLWIDWVANQIKFQVYNSSDTATTVTATTFGTINVNTWYFVEAWHDAVNNVIGVAVNTTSNTTAHTTGVKDDTGPFQLGAANGASFYQGNIDEFGFWKYMPASGDRTFLYYSGSGRTYANISDWTTIDTKHNSLTAGTYIFMQAAPGGVPQIEALQVTANGSAVSGGYRYPVIRNLDGTGNNTWVAGDALVSLGSAVGQGYIDLTSTATIHNQYGPTITVFARTSTATWNGTKPVVTMGNLRSFVDYAGDEYGQAGGNDLTLNPASGFAGYTIDRSNGLRLFNTDLRLYSGATEAIRLNNSVGLRFVTGSAAINTVAWFNAIGGYDQGYLYGNLISGTASLNLRAQAKDVGTGAFSGYADVILSNATTTSSVKLLANDGSVDGPNKYLLVSHTAVSISKLPLIVYGDVIETAIGTDNVRFGVNGGYPRIMLEDAGSTQWAIDNTAGLLRFFTPGVVRMSLTANGGLSLAPAAGNTGIYINPGASQTSSALYIDNFDNGSSYGGFITIGRNNNGSTPAAGFLYMAARTGTMVPIWVDNAGTMRLMTGALPTYVNDTAGTVIGSQTSSLDSKNIIKTFTDYSGALNAIIDAPLFDFTYKSGAFGGQCFTGIVTDHAPVFGMDRDEAHPAGKSLNEITAHGYTFAAIKAMHARIEELENQVRMLTHAN